MCVFVYVCVCVCVSEQRPGASELCGLYACVKLCLCVYCVPLSLPLSALSLSEQILFKDGHQVALEVDVDGVGHLQRRREQREALKEESPFYKTRNQCFF